MHSMDFLQYAYLQIGDNVKAKGMMDDLLAFKRDDVEKEYKQYYDAMAADFPARYALERRQWKDALELQPRTGVAPTEEAITYWAQTIAAGHLRDAAAAQKAAAKYEDLRATALKGRKGYQGKGMKTDHEELLAWLAFAQGNNDEALRRIRALADTQDAKGKAEVALPAREMLADMLLALDRPQEALAEYEKALHTDPNRFNGLYGAAQAAEATKQPQKAAEYYAQLLKNCDNGEHSDRPELAHAKTLVAQIKPLTTAQQSAN
jgi:tetratricopeptide (TPR) repeat protein